MEETVRPEVEKVGEPDDTAKMFVLDGKQTEGKESVKNAVREMRRRSPKVRPNGIFKHPETWEQQELDFIADCLKQNIPLYTIANMVHCERHTLANLVESRPELRQLKEDKYDNLLDEAEYQADRLMKAGNASIVIHVLSTLGRKRGWVEDGSEGQGADEGRIVMGIIPDDDVQKANDETKELQKNLGLAPLNPLQLAQTEEAVKAEVDKRMNVVEVEGESKSPLEGGGGESVSDVIERETVDGYARTDGNIQYDNDPWSSGADSPFFQ